MKTVAFAWLIFALAACESDGFYLRTAAAPSDSFDSFDCSNEAPPNCSEFSSSFSTEDGSERPTATFASGEIISFRIRKTNNSNSPQTLTSNACPSNFEVKNSAGETVWEWGANTRNVPLMLCVPCYKHAPGETTGGALEWDQRQLDDNEQVPAGQYTVRFFDSTECGSTLGKSATFEVQ